MKIYIGGSLNGRARLANEAKYLIDSGHVVLSRWFSAHTPIESLWNNQFNSEVSEVMAMRDTYDIMEADIVIIDSLEPSTSGGRETELGLALMRALLGHPLRIIHVGPYTNIFHNLVREHYGSWEELLEDSGL